MSLIPPPPTLNRRYARFPSGASCAERARILVAVYGMSIEQVLTLDDRHSCVVRGVLPNESSLHITLEPTQRKLYVFASILDRLPVDLDTRHRLAAVQLQGAILGRDFGGHGGLGLALPDQYVLMHTIVSVDALETDALAVAVWEFVPQVKGWRKKLKDVIDGVDVDAQPLPPDAKPDAVAERLLRRGTRSNDAEALPALEEVMQMPGVSKTLRALAYFARGAAVFGQQPTAGCADLCRALTLDPHVSRSARMLWHLVGPLTLKRYLLTEYITLPLGSTFPHMHSDMTVRASLNAVEDLKSIDPDRAKGALNEAMSICLVDDDRAALLDAELYARVTTQWMHVVGRDEATYLKNKVAQQSIQVHATVANLLCAADIAKGVDKRCDHLARALHLFQAQQPSLVLPPLPNEDDVDVDSRSPLPSLATQKALRTLRELAAMENIQVLPDGPKITTEYLLRCLAGSYLTVGNYEAALSPLLQLLEREPTLRRYLALASIYLVLEQYDQVEDALELAMALPGDRLVVTLFRARMLAAQGRVDAAFDLLRPKYLEASAAAALCCAATDAAERRQAVPQPEDGSPPPPPPPPLSQSMYDLLIDWAMLLWMQGRVDETHTQLTAVHYISAAPRESLMWHCLLLAWESKWEECVGLKKITYSKEHLSPMDWLVCFLVKPHKIDSVPRYARDMMCDYNVMADFSAAPVCTWRWLHLCFTQAVRAEADGWQCAYAHAARAFVLPPALQAGIPALCARVTQSTR